MNKLRFLLGLLFASYLVPVIAQTWFPTGATWHYDYANGSFVGYVTHEVVGAASIAGHACKELERTRVTYETFTGTSSSVTLSAIYSYDSAGVVWIYVPNELSFDTLYDMNALPGTTWNLAPLPEAFDAASYAEVMDTGVMVIDGVPLRWSAIDVRCPNEWSWVLHDTIIERIGTRSYLLPQDFCLAAVDGSEGGGLRCYQDAEIDYSTGAAPSCDFIVGVEEPVRDSSFEVYPNPGYDQLFISTSSDSFGVVTLRDPLGRIIYTERLSSARATVDSSTWPAGCYSVVIRSQNGYRSAQRWIKR